MGYKVSFLDNERYGADDINKITSRLVTSGVADIFADGVPYNTTKVVNGVMQAISHSGVVPASVNSCKVTKISEGNIKILKGLAYFNNGTSIEIDNDGVDLQYATGTKNYVYVKSDLTANAITAHCTTIAPDGDYVMLAEIESNGTIVDKRKYAKGKLPGYQSNANGTLSYNFNDVSITASDNGIKTKQIYYTPGEFKGMVINSKNSVGNCGVAHFDFETGRRYNAYYGGSSRGDLSTTDNVLTLYMRGPSLYTKQVQYEENSEGMLFTFTSTESTTFDFVNVVFY